MLAKTRNNYDEFFTKNCRLVYADLIKGSGVLKLSIGKETSHVFILEFLQTLKSNYEYECSYLST